MAAAYNAFNGFCGDIGLASHPNLNTDTHRVVLTNTTPVNTNTILANITQIANGNGYTTDGEDAQNAFSRSGGTATLSASQIVWTGGAGGMATFEWVVYYSQNSANLVNPLISWWDYASGLALAVGETFTWKPNSGASGTVLTIAVT
jgi:hypothetical protein